MKTKSQPMDNRIRDAKHDVISAILDIDDNIDRDIVLKAFNRYVTLLTAEPEPCEDLDKDALTIDRVIRYPEHFPGLAGEASSALDRIVLRCRVSDKRVEELRAENIKLKKRIDDLEKECATPILVNTALLADRLSESREHIDMLREALYKILPLAENYWLHISARPYDNADMRKNIDGAKTIVAIGVEK